MTPPLPDNYPPLKPLVRRGSQVETSYPQKNNSTEANRYSLSFLEYLSSESGASVTEGMSPVSSVSTVAWTEGSRKLSDAQAVVQNVTTTKNHKQDGLNDSVNCQLRSRWLGTGARTDFPKKSSEQVCVREELRGTLKQVQLKKKLNESIVQRRETQVKREKVMQILKT